MRLATDVVIDTLHAAGVAGFTYDPAVDAPIAVVHAGGGLGGCDFWWASCKRCWWWCEDEAEYPNSARTPEEAQRRADAHNVQHHPNHKEKTTNT